MAISQEYKEFSAENPWGRGATVVTPDNVVHSRVRQEAIMALRKGTATPEQQALVHEADAAIQSALRSETPAAAPAVGTPVSRRITL